MLELGAVGLELIDRLDELPPGARLDIDLLEILLLGVRVEMDLFEMLRLGVWLDMDLPDVILLGVRLVMALLLEFRLDEMLLELLDDDGLDDTLGAGAGLETCRLG